MSEYKSLPVFLKRPSFYLDENVAYDYTVDFIPPITGKDVLKDSDILDNLLSYLGKLDMDNSSELTSINKVKEEMESSEEESSEGSEEGSAPPEEETPAGGAEDLLGSV